MLKNILFILILTGVHFQFQAQITYTPVFIDGCTHEVFHPENWMLVDALGYSASNQNSEKSIVLPREGDYQLILSSVLSELVVHIGTQTVQKDTLLLPRLTKAYLLSDPPITVYTDCENTLAEGSITEYYLDSTIRLKGVFKQGRAVDSVWNYHPNGNPAQLERYTASGVNYLKKTYFESGGIKTVSHLSKEEFEEYYENGSLKLEESLLKRMAFDSLGRTKSLIKKHKVLFTSFGIFPGTYKTKWTSYNASGQKTQRINQKSFGFGPINKSTSGIQHTEFEKAIFWKNGKKHVKIDPMYDDGLHFIVLQRSERKWKEVARVEKEGLHETIEAITNGKEY